MDDSDRLFILLVFIFTWPHLVESMNEPPLTREMNSNVGFGKVTEATISQETGVMKVSVNFEIVCIRCDLGMSIPYSNAHLGNDALEHGLQIMEVAERYPEVKTVRILITTDEPSIPKIVSLETHTQSGIDWKNETVSEDLETYSKEKFDKVVWYIDISK